MMNGPPAGEAPNGPAVTGTAAALRPVQEHERIRSLDVLRGVAIFGIFCINIQFFSLPLMEAVGHLSIGSAPLTEQLGWAFIKVFFEFKFISMFSLLFGAGLVIQMTRAEAAGRGFAPVYLRRLGVLALFGLCHALLLWYGDILLIYAVLGTILLAVRRLRAKTLFITAGSCVLLGSLLTGSCAGLQMVAGGMAARQAEMDAAPEDDVEAAAEATGAQQVAEAGDEATSEPADASAAGDAPTPDGDSPDAAPADGWAAMTAAQFDPSREVWIQAEVRAYRDGPFADAFLFRAVSYGFAAISAIFGYGWRVAGMFMLGAALMKVDFFRPHMITWQRRLMLWGLGIGLPIELLANSLHWIGGFDLDGYWLAATFLHDLGSFALCLGYVAAITWGVSRGASGLLPTALSKVGRLALSTYLMETIISTGIMYWWGLGRFDSLGRPQLLGLVVVVYAGLIVFSTVWLKLFRIGPFEWLWRSLTYLRPQPLRRVP